MGNYDEFAKDDFRVQIKSGPCDTVIFEEGDNVDDVIRNDGVKVKGTIIDGIHIGYEGIVVIKDRIVVAIFSSEEIFDKWGLDIDLEEIMEERNPLSKMLEDNVDVENVSIKEYLNKKVFQIRRRKRSED